MFTLTDQQIEQIDQTSRQMLSQVGVRVDDEQLRQQALAAGAKPGRTADAILLPPAMVQQYLATAPPSAVIADRRGHRIVLRAGCRPVFWTGAALLYVQGTHARPIQSTDLATLARIADRLPNVSGVVGTSIDDVPPAARDVVGLRILAENTSKHLRPLLLTSAGIEPMMEMAQVLADGQHLAELPLVSFGYSCLSPLHWPQIACDLWRRTAGHKLPVMLNAEPIAGATSPVTLSGSLALSNAEILAGVVLVQLIEPGRPVIHNLGFAHTIDMRSAACLSGSPECALMAAAGGQLAAHYGLPSAAWMCTDSMLEDQQAAMEKTLTGLAQVSGGVSLIWGVGQLETQKALSPVQVVIDDALAAALLRCWDGFQVDAETLAFEVVEEVVRSGQDFLAHPHTLSHFRDELSESPLMSRTQRQQWESAGATNLVQRAADRVRQILAEPAEPLLSDDQRKQLLAIEQRALDRCR